MLPCKCFNTLIASQTRSGLPNAQNAGNAGTWWDTSVLVTTVRNFPDDR